MSEFFTEYFIVCPSFFQRQRPGTIVFFHPAISRPDGTVWEKHTGVGIFIESVPYLKNQFLISVRQRKDMDFFFVFSWFCGQLVFYEIQQENRKQTRRQDEGEAGEFKDCHIWLWLVENLRNVSLSFGWCSNLIWQSWGL